VSAPSPGSGSPSGTVSFFDGSTLLGSAPVAGGVASLSLFEPRLGARSLSAVYAGDVKFLGSISPTLPLRVVTSASPVSAGIRDVGNDQGRQVRLSFRASPFDLPGSATPIVHYDVFRQIPAGAAPAAVEPSPAVSTLRGAAPRRGVPAPDVALVYGWDFVGTVSAYDDSIYSLVVPTLADSNSSGLHRTTLFVRAATSNPIVYFDSAPDSGYSVDNLPPVAPAPFMAAYAAGATNLHWGANSEPDFWYYKLYRGSSAGFTPGAGNQIASKSDTGYVDVGPAGGYYKLSAVDVNGNESGYSLVTPASTLQVDDGPLSFALERLPNPASGGPLTVTFSLPSDARATLEVVDVSGRRVFRREVGALGAGRHSIVLAGGEPLSAGVYFVRLTQGACRATGRVTVLE
jgi:hypothetical protein